MRKVGFGKTPVRNKRKIVGGRGGTLTKKKKKIPNFSKKHLFLFIPGKMLLNQIFFKSSPSPTSDIKFLTKTDKNC